MHDHPVDVEALVREMREPVQVRWATRLVRRLEVGQAGSARAWARETFHHTLHHPALDAEQVARRLHHDLIDSGRPLHSIDAVRRLWPDHEGRHLHIAVLRLWTGLWLDGLTDDMGSAVELLHDDARLGAHAREAPLLLFRHYLTTAHSGH